MDVIRWHFLSDQWMCPDFHEAAPASCRHRTSLWLTPWNQFKEEMSRAEGLILCCFADDSELKTKYNKETTPDHATSEARRRTFDISFVLVTSALDAFALGLAHLGTWICRSARCLRCVQRGRLQTGLRLVFLLGGFQGYVLHNALLWARHVEMPTIAQHHGQDPAKLLSRWYCNVWWSFELCSVIMNILITVVRVIDKHFNTQNFLCHHSVPLSFVSIKLLCQSNCCVNT